MKEKEKIRYLLRLKPNRMPVVCISVVCVRKKNNISSYAIGYFDINWLEKRFFSDLN